MSSILHPLNPSDLPGAVPGVCPGRLVPQLPTLVQAPPSGENWLHEIKHDGYRMTVTVEGDQVRLWTRNGYDWSDRLPAISDALGDLGLRGTAMDAELVCLDEEGKTDFELLQRCMAAGRGRRLLYLFDLVYFDGWDLSRSPLLERKELLRQVLEERTDRAASLLRFSDHILGEGSRVFWHACRFGLEGIVSKRADSRYRAGKRSPDWRKTKNPVYYREFAGEWSGRNRMKNIVDSPEQFWH